MNSPQIRQFIVGFLLLSFLTGAVFTASLYRGRGTSAQPEGSAQIERAFAPTMTGGSRDAELAAIEAMQENGATNELASSLADELIQKNPNGPTEKDGKLTITSPDLNAVISTYVASHPISADAVFPAMSERDLATSDAVDSETISKYLSEVDNITAQLQKAPRLTTASPDDLADNLMIMQQAVNDAQKIVVPRPLLKMHVALLRALSSSTNYTQLLGTDPVSAAALTDAYNREITQATTDLEREADKAQSLGFLPSESRPLAARLLGIPAAHALIVADIITHIRLILDWVWNHRQAVLDVLTEFLKNTILKRMTSQLMQWIAGNGEPQFVTNWQSFLQNASLGAASQALASQYPTLCNNLGSNADVISKILQGNGPNVAPSTGCKSAGAIPNLTDFHADFRNGGWNSYVKLLQPQNNFLGAFTITSELQRAAAAQAAETSKTKAIAGNGFKGQELCDNGKPPMTKAQADTQTQSFAAAGKDKTFSAGDCADGSQPHIATPGVFSKDLSSQGFNSAYERLATAKDYKALSAFAADMLLSRFMKGGKGGLLGFIGGKSSGGNPKAPTAPEPEQPAGTAEGEVQQILNRKQSSLDDARSALSTLDDTIATLHQVVNTCTANQSIVDDSNAEIQGLISLQDEMTAKIEELKPQVEALQSFTGTLDQLHAQFGTVDQAQAEAEAVSSKRADADSVYLQAGNLFNSCSTDVLNGPVDTGDSSSTDTGTLP